MYPFTQWFWFLENGQLFETKPNQREISPLLYLTLFHKKTFPHQRLPSLPLFSPTVSSLGVNTKLKLSPNLAIKIFGVPTVDFDISLRAGI